MKAKELSPVTRQIQKRFFAALDVIMLRNGMSLQAFCNEYGLLRPKYSNIRAGKDEYYKHIDIEALAYLVHDFGVSSDWLLTGVGDMFKKVNVLQRVLIN